MLHEITPRSPKEIIIKALYSRLLGLQRNDDQADLELDSSTEDLPHLLSRFIFHFGQPPGLTSVEDFKDLRNDFSVALRHKDDQYDLCLEVAKQALDKGIPYATYAVSPAARMLKNVCKEVIVEVNRAKGLRFNPHPEQRAIYWAEYTICHNTADIVLKYFSRRYPMRILAIYSRREVYWLKSGQYFCQDIGEFSLASIDPKFQQPSYLRAAR